jgi:hypothetical protein
MKKISLYIFLTFCQIGFAQSEFSKLPSGIYFKDSNNIISIDPTLVNTIKGSRFLTAYGRKQKSIAQIDGREANYVVSSDVKFYFKFKPEQKELNSSNSNATNKVGEENYINLLFAASTGSTKAISPNEFKLVKLKFKKGKRSFINGKYRLYGIEYEPSIDPKSIVDFKYKKIDENLYEIYFPNGLNLSEYCFVYMGGFSEQYIWLRNSNIKVFDFSVK